MRHIFFRILAGLVLIAAVAGIGVLAYNAGAAHQAAITTASPVQGSQTGSPVVLTPFWWPFPFLGFGFFGLLGLFFLFWVAFGALRFLFWGPRFGWRRWQRGYGHWGERGSGEDYPIPPMMAELHRRMHSADRESTGKSADQSTQNQA